MSESKSGATPMPMCPMAETCKGVMEKPLSRSMTVVPGIVFILLGVLIVIEPIILAWIIAAGFILLGVVMLMAANFVRKIGKQLQDKSRRTA